MKSAEKKVRSRWTETMCCQYLESLEAKQRHRRSSKVQWVTCLFPRGVHTRISTGLRHSAWQHAPDKSSATAVERRRSLDARLTTSIKTSCRLLSRCISHQCSDPRTHVTDTQRTSIPSIAGGPPCSFSKCTTPRFHFAAIVSTTVITVQRVYVHLTRRWVRDTEVSHKPVFSVQFFWYNERHTTVSHKTIELPPSQVKIVGRQARLRPLIEVELVFIGHPL